MSINGLWNGSHRDKCVYAPNQWETTVQCNVVSHWLGTFTKTNPGLEYPLLLSATPEASIKIPVLILLPQLIVISLCKHKIREKYTLLWISLAAVWFIKRKKENIITKRDFWCLITQRNYSKYFQNKNPIFQPLQDLEKLLNSLQWRHNEHGGSGVSNDWCLDGLLLNHLFRHRSKKTSRFRVTGLCGGNSPVTGEFPTQCEFPSQRASNAENVSIWWRHHVLLHSLKTLIYIFFKH